MARPCWALAVLAGMAVLTPSATPAQDRLEVRNPGFEFDEDGDGLPDHWGLSWRATHSGEAAENTRKQEPDWAWDREVKHSGRASIRCGVVRPTDDGVWTQEGILPPEGARYLRLTAWCRARDVDKGEANVAVVFLGEGGKWVDATYRAIAVTQDCDWTQYTGYAEVPAGTVALRLRCWVNFSYRGTGTFWFDDLEVTRVDEMVKPRTVYLDETAPPDVTDEERVRGFLLFSRSRVRVLFPNAVPAAEERVRALSVAACPGEYEPMVLAVRALRDLQGLCVSVGNLTGDAGVIPAQAVDVRSVRFHPKEGQARWGPFNETLMEVPLFLEKRESLTVAASRNQPFWLTIHVPADARPGAYSGSVTVQAAGGPGARLPVTVEVYPFTPDQPTGVTFAMYTRMRSDRAWIAEAFADLRAHGMTGVALCGNSGLALSLRDGQVMVDWTGDSPLERNMDEYTRAGFPEPMVWLMGGDIPRFCEGLAPRAGEDFARAYRQIITAIVEHGKHAGWPEIIFQPVDEPFEHADRLEEGLRLLRILKTIPGLRTEENGMNGRWGSFTDDWYQATDVLVLHDGPTLHRGQLDMARWWDFHSRATADGKTLWFYNIDLTAWHPEPIRFMTGFGLWKSKAAGVIEWAYMFPVREDDPGAVYSQPRALLYRFPEAPGESGGPCVAYEAVREGVDDYRYLLTLSRLVEQAQASGKAEVAALAEELWRPVQEKLDLASFEGCRGSAAQGEWTGRCEYLPDGNRGVRGDHKIANRWELADYDALRRCLAQAIVQLRLALDRWTRSSEGPGPCRPGAATPWSQSRVSETPG